MEEFGVSIASGIVGGLIPQYFYSWLQFYGVTILSHGLRTNIPRIRIEGTWVLADTEEDSVYFQKKLLKSNRKRMDQRTTCSCF